MREILEHCDRLPTEVVADGTVLLAEGQSTGRAYVLTKGRIEVIRGDTQIAVCDEPGSVFGEMSILLGRPHTATVRALGDAEVHVMADGGALLRANPRLLWLVAQLLANRLNAATSYLADLKQQFAEYDDHLEMVGEVLEALFHAQEREFDPGSQRDPDGT